MILTGNSNCCFTTAAIPALSAWAMTETHLGAKNAFLTSTNEQGIQLRHGLHCLNAIFLAVQDPCRS